MGKPADGVRSGPDATVSLPLLFLLLLSLPSLEKSQHSRSACSVPGAVISCAKSAPTPNAICRERVEHLGAVLGLQEVLLVHHARLPGPALAAAATRLRLGRLAEGAAAGTAVALLVVGLGAS